MGKWPISPWMEWFAWYPVKVIYEHKIHNHIYPDDPPATLRLYKHVWLKKIWRRRMLSSIPTGEQALVWEYKDKHIFDILRDS